MDIKHCLFIGSLYTKSQLKFKCTHLRSLRALKNQYQTVIASRVLENTTNPINVLKMIKEYLTDNGTLIILCQNINNMVKCKLPANQLNHFSTNSLNQLCNKAGLKLIDILYDEIILISNDHTQKSNIPDKLYTEIIDDVYSDNHILKYVHHVLSFRTAFHICLGLVKKLNYFQDSYIVP